jgi:hypothetical protein
MSAASRRRADGLRLGTAQRVALLASVLLSCGYRFTAAGGALPGGARQVYAPTFVNRTSDAGVEALFTTAFRDELSRAGREGGPAADAIAVGEVTSVQGGAAIVSSDVTSHGAVVFGSVVSYRVNASVVVRLMRGGETLSEIRVAGHEDYLPGQSILEAEANRRAALKRLAAVLMQQARESLASGF